MADYPLTAAKIKEEFKRAGIHFVVALPDRVQLIRRVIPELVPALCARLSEQERPQIAAVVILIGQLDANHAGKRRMLRQQSDCHGFGSGSEGIGTNPFRTGSASTLTS